MNLFNLFPTPVAKFSLTREFTDFELGFCNSQEKTPNVGNTVSKDRYVFNNNHMNDIREFAVSSLDTYFKQIYSPLNAVSLRVTQSWFNYSKPGQYHHKHAHPNSFISGVLYMKAAKERDKIYFHNEGYRQIELPVENFNAYNSRSWWLPVGTGDLFLFPSSFSHSVEPVQEEERISLSFNTFPVGYVGHEDALTALHLRD